MNARCPFSPMPAQTMSVGSARRRSSYSRQVRSGRSARSPGIRRSCSGPRPTRRNRCSWRYRRNESGWSAPMPRYSSMWKATTRVQSIPCWATSSARSSFWLGAAAKTIFARPPSSCRATIWLRQVAGRGPARQGTRLVDQDLQHIHDKLRDRRRLGDAHDRDPAARNRMGTARGDRAPAASERSFAVNLPHSSRGCQSIPRASSRTATGSDGWISSSPPTVASRRHARHRRGAVRRASGIDPGRRAWPR